MSKNVTDNLTHKLKNRSVIVTGSCGYIGSELIGRLKAGGFRCLGIDKIADNTASLSLDLCDKKPAIRTIRDFSPDCLIHCGTYSALAYRDNPLQSFEQDAAALVNILTALLEFPDTRLIVFSSSYVYSGQNTDKTVTEETILSPTHNFGLAKAFFEQLAIRSHPNTVVLRLSSVFGPGRCLHPNAIENMAGECLLCNQLTVWGKGCRKMQYVYIDDVSGITFEALSLKCGIYNVGADEYVSVAQTAKIIAEFYNSQIIFLEDRKEGESLPFMDNTRIKNTLKKNCFTPLTVALHKYLEKLQESNVCAERIYDCQSCR